MLVRFFPIALIALSLAGCARPPQEQVLQPDDDPLLTSALADPIMVDRQLADQNLADVAIVPGAAMSMDVPPELAGPDTAGAAKGDAAALTGGMQRAPDPGPSLPTDAAIRDAVTAAQLAAAAGVSSGDCIARIAYSARYAAALPPFLPVYPRGAVQEAAGTDAGGCGLRAVTYVTSVSPGDVIDFYYTLARAGKRQAAHRGGDSGQILAGSGWLVQVRPLASGLSQVDLVSAER